jgi:protein-S-isoprenylcysteine O-methyltransferase Ste14
MLPLLIAFVIMTVFYSIESYLRYGDAAKSREAGKTDKKSTLYLKRVFSINLAVLLSGFLLFQFTKLAIVNKWIYPYSGDLVMLAGLFTRIMATRTLKQYYTRTLKIQADQKVIDFGMYKYIRHPGYLGLLMIWTGAAFASNNWFIFVWITLSSIIVYHYRMRSEEQMLVQAFGESYINYKKHTWRLIPWLY